MREPNLGRIAVVIAYLQKIKYERIVTSYLSDQCIISVAIRENGGLMYQMEINSKLLERDLLYTTSERPDDHIAAIFTRMYQRSLMNRNITWSQAHGQ